MYQNHVVQRKFREIKKKSNSSIFRETVLFCSFCTTPSQRNPIFNLRGSRKFHFCHHFLGVMICYIDVGDEFMGYIDVGDACRPIFRVMITELWSPSVHLSVFARTKCPCASFWWHWCWWHNMVSMFSELFARNSWFYFVYLTCFRLASKIGFRVCSILFNSVQFQLPFGKFRLGYFQDFYLRELY